DINAVRIRAGADPISPSEVNLDFILDERARELLFEEPRRRTLIRMGKLVDRARQYGLLESSRNTIQDFHGLWPIPQNVIDANFGADLDQNGININLKIISIKNHLKQRNPLVFLNEILVGFVEASYNDTTRGLHTYDASSARNKYARSLDGGVTWKIEDAFTAGQLLGGMTTISVPGKL